MQNQMLVFHASGVDSSSVTSHDSGTNIDLCAFPSSAVTSMVAEEDYVYLYFKDGTRFEDGVAVGGSVIETMEQAYVRLTVAEGKEIDVIKDLSVAINSGSSQDGLLLFDAVNSTWAISNVTAIQIRRHLTAHTIASD